jgi:chaperonin GroES
MASEVKWCSLRLLGFKIAVIADPEQAKTKGGIYIADVARERPLTGTVVAAGPGQHEYGVFVANGIKAGDRVAWQKHAGHILFYDGREYLIMFQGDVLAILED